MYILPWNIRSDNGTFGTWLLTTDYSPHRLICYLQYWYWYPKFKFADIDWKIFKCFKDLFKISQWLYHINDQALPQNILTVCQLLHFFLCHVWLLQFRVGESHSVHLACGSERLLNHLLSRVQKLGVCSVKILVVI